MKHRQVTAILLSIVIAMSACVPMRGAEAFAAESTSSTEAGSALEQDGVEAADAEEVPETDGAAGAEEAAETTDDAAITDDAVTTEEDTKAEQATATEEYETAGTAMTFVDADAAESTDAATAASTATAATEEAAATTAVEASAATTAVEASAAATAVEAHTATSAAAAATAEAARLPEMIEIIESDSAVESSSREAKSADAAPISAEELLSRIIIPTDVSSASSGCALVGVPGTYISDPDGVLARINEIRREACEEGVRDPGTGKPLTMADYVPIKWSGDLEYIARIRAAESAFIKNHKRTNESMFSTLTSPGGVGTEGEVIARNNGSSITYGIDQWYGEKSDWTNQVSGAETGHYTQMIDPANRYVGLGTFLSDDSFYYNTTVGEFSKESGLDESSMEFTGECVQMLEMKISNLNAEGEVIGNMIGEIGEKREHLLGTKTRYELSEGNVYLMSGVTWNSSDTSVVTVSSDGEMTIKGLGRAFLYASFADGSITAEAVFVKRELQDCTIEPSPASLVYDGKGKEPKAAVTFRGTELKEGIDYTLSYRNNVNAGTGEIIVTGIGEYGGTDSGTFVIEKAEQGMYCDPPYITYPGQVYEFTIAKCATTPTIEFLETGIATAEVVDGGPRIRITTVGVGSTDFVISAPGNENYKPGKGQYYIQVLPYIMQETSIKVTGAVYDGTPKKPTVKVVHNGKTLKEGTDYSLEYESQTNAGSYYVTIRGNGNYEGAITKTYKITKAEQNIEAEDLSLHPYEKAKVPVTGAQGKLSYQSADTSVATVAKDGIVTAGQAGSAQITVNAAKTTNYNAASTVMNVSVTAYDLSSQECITELGVTEYACDGTQKRPAVATVRFGDITLIEGTDYTVSYGENTNPGKGSVTITGNNKTTTGSKTLYFTITKAEQKLTAENLTIHPGEKAKVQVTGAQGSLSYQSADTSVATVAKDGTVTAVRTGTTRITVKASETDKYKAGSTTLTVSVTPYDLSSSKTVLKLEEDRFVYNGNAREPKVIVRYDGKPVTDGFTIEYKNNIDPGLMTAKVIITGDGKTFKGTREQAFTILPGKTARGDMFNLAGNIKVTWKEVPGAKYYKVYREGLTDPKESLDEPVIVTAGLIGWDNQQGLTNGNAYRYRIAASLTGKEDSSGDSPLSYSKVTYRLKTVALRSVKNTGPGKVTVKYDKTVSGDSYVLQYSERQDMAGAKTKVVLGANNTTYVIGGLKKGKTYYVSIRVRKKVSGIDYYTTFGVPKKVTITK